VQIASTSASEYVLTYQTCFYLSPCKEGTLITAIVVNNYNDWCVTGCWHGCQWEGGSAISLGQGGAAGDGL
jgi:hypothetical protein